MNKLLIAMLALMAAISCKSKRAITAKQQEPVVSEAKQSAKAQLFSTIEQNPNTFTFYQATGEMSYRDDQQSQELGVTITMEKDQYLLMNVTALLGITVARIWATPDSIVILDMLHRKAMVADYAYVKRQTGAELSFKQLQQLIIGNTLYPHQEIRSLVDTIPETYRVTEVIAQGITQQTLYGLNYHVKKTIITDTQKRQELIIEYPAVYTEGRNLFPSTLNINIRAEKKAETNLDLKTFVFEKKKDVQFSIPRSYERVRL
jgi:outer membrane biogenesis lipoprotein LolB